MLFVDVRLLFVFCSCSECFSHCLCCLCVMFILVVLFMSLFICMTSFEFECSDWLLCKSSGRLSSFFCFFFLQNYIFPQRFVYLFFIKPFFVNLSLLIYL